MCYANFIGLKVRITDRESCYHGAEGEIVRISTENEEAIYSIEMHLWKSIWRVGFIEGEFEFIG